MGTEGNCYVLKCSQVPSLLERNPMGSFLEGWKMWQKIVEEEKSESLWSSVKLENRNNEEINLISNSWNLTAPQRLVFASSTNWNPLKSGVNCKLNCLSLSLLSTSRWLFHRFSSWICLIEPRWKLRIATWGKCTYHGMLYISVDILSNWGRWKGAKEKESWRERQF